MNGRLIYDFGLHKGEDTAYYLKKGFNVVAFEADPDLVAHCKRRFREAISSGSLRIVEGAIAPRSAGDKVTFYKNGCSVWGTISSEWSHRNAMLGSPSETITAPRVDALECLTKHGVPHYLKIDIEGADKIILDALLASKDRPRYLSIESEKVNFAELQEEIAVLKGLGYSRFKIVQQQSIPGTRIKVRTLDGVEFEHVFEAEASGAFGDDLPGPWLSHDETLHQYKTIFRRYRLFGDESLVERRFPPMMRKAVRATFRLATGYRGPLPGWYDTHACLD